ncbi:1,2-phenylacetyl-CoA epoxidase subunit PaaD [Phycicoccus sp. M110.8]|uniref:1,2-phenylacetyl-CoA epoxidase subunit PaaD n=1 Tax=Phycicoccus sp. M110.8 TaxID=3075433 RepID=UPI0028FD0BE1|nr:1,2-phenylacetyl-CoA epoxidase subunit PaaD [Phycicoccus sp. M110.8]MDU0313392.1 1,2-phenylacetyl-CoA epoxidase subunit PaaD [Phycicoccus sp. M110.8]
MTAVSTRVDGLHEPPARRGAAGLQERAYAVARTVTDPELPMLTLEDLGVLRGVEVDADGTVVVSITPTYSGCPAMATMRDDLVRALAEAGLEARVAVALSPAWSSDWISERGRAALAEAGISAPHPVGRRVGSGPVPLTLAPTRRAVTCPRCGSADTALTSEFGPTSCKALYRCTSCLEPFEHVKEI